MDFETEIKLTIYEMIANEAVIPDTITVANKIKAPEKKVEEVFQKLAAKRLLVLEPGNPAKIRMAPPFSGIETPFLIEINQKSYYANCVWDAFGISAALHQDGIIYSSDGYTKEPLILEIEDDRPIQSNYLAHFAVPAAHWWDDIIHT
ncbi:MAG: organomercurial lyase [Anaerolineales bacterium]